MIREGAIRRLTRDQSLVQRLVDRGVISEEEAADRPDRNVLKRFPRWVCAAPCWLPTLPPNEHTSKPATPCCCARMSLHGLVADAELLDTVTRYKNRHLVELVPLPKEIGGPDNITLQIARLTGALPRASPQE